MKISGIETNAFTPSAAVKGLLGFLFLAAVFACDPMPISAQVQDGLRMAKSSQNDPDDPRGLLVYKTQIDKLKATAQNFKGGTEGLYVGMSAEEWGFRSVSATARAKFLEKVGTNMSDRLKNQLSGMLDEIKPILEAKIPLLKPDPRNFSASASALESRMKALLKPNVTVFRSGMGSSDWSITKKPSGIPDFRARYGYLYIRDKDADHRFCEVVRYYFREPYDGSAYGAVEVSVSESYLVGCPA